MILILTESDDPHADRVIELLEQKRASWYRFNPADYPTQTELTFAIASDGRKRSTLKKDGRTINFSDIQFTWNRRPKPAVAHIEIKDDDARKFASDECNEFVRDLWHTLDCRWMPGQPSTIHRAQMKAMQLQMASKLGFELPPTLISNCPQEFLDFYNQHGGKIITKLVGFGFERSFGTTFCRYAEVVSPSQLGFVDSIKYCPMIVQAYVPKQLELRITVVGKRVFSAEIHSQVSNHTRFDWRRYDLNQTPHFPHSLPHGIENQCVRLVESLGLTYGAIDMILTPEGKYVFVEINPNGQYLWIEHQTGLQISEAICDLLMSSPVASSQGFSATMPASPS